MLTHYVLKQKTRLPIIPYFGLIFRNCSFTGLGIGNFRPKQQVELALERHGDGIEAARAQDLKISLVLRANPNVFDFLTRSAVFDDQVGFALNRQRPDLPRIDRVVDRARRNLLAKD